MEKKIEIKNQEQRNLYNKFMQDIIDDQELLEYLREEIKLSNEEIINNFKYLFMVVPTIYKKINISIKVTDVDDYLTDMLTVNNEGQVVTVKNTILPKFMNISMDVNVVKLGKKAVSLLNRGSFLMDEIGYIKLPELDFCTVIEKQGSDSVTVMLVYYRRMKDLKEDVSFNYELANE